MGYGLEQHETDGYKSPHTISPALMKRESVQSHTHRDSVQFLHPAPAEEIFKDPLWVTFFFNFPSFTGVESSKWVLKIFHGGLQKDIFCASPLGYLFAHTGNDC